MANIHFEANDSEETFMIDETSQRLLVYLHLHGGVSPEETIDPIGAMNESDVHTRVDENLGPQAAGLIEENRFTRNTLSGEQEVFQYQLTEEGEKFVFDNKATLSMPADLAELAKKVAELHVEQNNLRDFEDMIYDLEERITEIEEQL